MIKWKTAMAISGSLMIVLLCIGAAGAAGASFTAAKYPVTVKGSQEGSFKFTVGGSTVTCTALSSSAALSASSTVLESSSETTGCTAFGFLNSTTTMNGCKYKNFIGVGDGAGVYTGTTDLVCPAGKEKTIDAGPCTVHIPPQNGKVTITYTGQIWGVREHVNLTNWRTTVTAEFGCPVAAGEYTNASMTGIINLQATDSEGKAVGFDIG